MAAAGEGDGKVFGCEEKGREMEVVAGEAGEMESESRHFLGVQFVVLWKNIKIRES